MRLVIHAQGAAEAGLRRYNGRGIFSSIGRKLFLFGLKKVINDLEKPKSFHTIADAVVNGSPNRPIDNSKIVKTSLKGVKRKKEAVPTTIQPPTKIKKYSKDTTNKLINTSSGSGIILD